MSATTPIPAPELLARDRAGLAMKFKERERIGGHVRVGVFIGDKDGARPCVGELVLGIEEWDRLVGGAPVGGQPLFRRKASWGPNFGGDAPNAMCIWFSEPHRTSTVGAATASEQEQAE